MPALLNKKQLNFVTLLSVRRVSELSATFLMTQISIALLAKYQNKGLRYQSFS
jgi:hypothetical protein